MKETLYTIPLNDAVNADDECPLCFMERKIERDALDFTLGNSSSYMERDIRAQTDAEGFCRRHFKEMFDYGNALGSAWILSTHLRAISKELDAEIEKHEKKGTARPAKSKQEKTGGFLARMHAPKGVRTAGDSSRDLEAGANTDSIAAWVTDKEESCFVCRQIADTKARYIDTFFYLWQKDPQFREKILNGKGFCLPHFGDLCEAAKTGLPKEAQDEFYTEICGLMKKNLERITGDVDWMIEKFDYQHADEPWKNSKDAIQRAMQKLKGGYPADQPWRMKK